MKNIEVSAIYFTMLHMYSQTGHSTPYYRKLYEIDQNFTDVLLLYVSPQEKSNGDLLPKLKEEISQLTNGHLKHNLNYGILSSQSLFHNDVKDYFSKYIKSST